MKPVMLATDGSPAARTATTSAIDLARAFDAELVILSVRRSDPDAFAAPALAPVNGYGDLTELGGEQASYVAAEAAAAAERAGVRARPIVLPGPIVEAITRATEEFEPRVVVLGSHGWGVLGRRILGSRAEGVLESSACPVLVVPRAPAEATGASTPRGGSSRTRGTPKRALARSS